jgi:hypothetical protein
MATEVKASCHCGINTFRVRFDQNLIPFSSELCHCNTCRHVTGEMAFYHVPIQGRPLVGSIGNTLVEERDLNGYRVSPDVVRYLCGRCSAKMFMCKNETDWYVSGGVLERTEGIMKLGCHVHVAETKDGGIADQLPTVDGVDLPRYSAQEGSEELPMGWRSDSLKSRQESKGMKCLNAYCQCGAIKIYITRPDELSLKPTAPYPHVICPVHNRLSTIHNIKDEKWWLADYGPILPTKYLASHCVCIPCRRESGFDIQSWVFASRTNVFNAGSKTPINLSGDGIGCRPKDLKQYLASPGRYNEFCGKCGATVFWWQDERPDVIDISVGLLDQDQDGVRAEEWLKWHKERVGFAEDTMVGRSTIEGLVHGMAEFKG